MFWRIDVISVDRLGMLGVLREVLFFESDGEGCLDIVLVAWLVFLGRCLMLKC